MKRIGWKQKGLSAVLAMVVSFSVNAGQKDKDLFAPLTAKELTWLKQKKDRAYREVRKEAFGKDGLVVYHSQTTDLKTKAIDKLFKEQGVKDEEMKWDKCEVEEDHAIVTYHCFLVESGSMSMTYIEDTKELSSVAYEEEEKSDSSNSWGLVGVAVLNGINGLLKDRGERQDSYYKDLNRMRLEREKRDLERRKVESEERRTRALESVGYQLKQQSWNSKREEKKKSNSWKYYNDVSNPYNPYKHGSYNTYTNTYGN